MRRQLTALVAAGAVAATGVAGGLAAGAALLPAGAAQAQTGGGESQSLVAERVDGRHHGHHGQHGAGAAGMALDAATDALGISEAELREAMRDGRTLAEIAEEQGVSASAVVESLVSGAQRRLDEAVEDGRVSAERAEELATRLEERVRRLVEEGVPTHRAGH